VTMAHPFRDRGPTLRQFRFTEGERQELIRAVQTRIEALQDDRSGDQGRALTLLRQLLDRFCD
jgi:hypothetical protein